VSELTADQFWVKPGKSRSEQISSGLPSIADVKSSAKDYCRHANPVHPRSDTLNVWRFSTGQLRVRLRDGAQFRRHARRITFMRRYKVQLIETKIYETAIDVSLDRDCSAFILDNVISDAAIQALRDGRAKCVEVEDQGVLDYEEIND
jgi:hypothetical protein